MRATCQHAHGEYSDDYRHCFDCGREWMLIGGEWHEIEGWIRISTKFFEGETLEPGSETP